MYDNTIYKLAFKKLALFCFWIAVARLTNGVALALMGLVGIVWALKGSCGRAFSIYAMLMFMVIMNPNILPKEGIAYSLGLRFGPLLIGLVLSLNEMFKGNKFGLPMEGMVAYLIVASISSIGGWYPQVSYLKLVNFLIFFLGIWLGVKGVRKSEDEMQNFRATLLALSTFLIAGSLVLMPFPGISTLDAIRSFSDIEDIGLRNEILREMLENGGMGLFCGVTFHSQTMAPVSACAFAWVLCDLLFVEGKFRLPHVVLLLCAFPLLYRTRSRVALLCLTVTLSLAYFYLPRKIELGHKMKKWLGHILLVGGVSLAIVIVIAEVRNSAITRWLRKTDNVEYDQRTLAEAFTSSRQGLIDECLDDFKLNPLLGMGFQVSRDTPIMMAGQKGLILSSPIEKGVLPLMVLGETGVVGAIVFAGFLITFYIGCANRKFYVTSSLMTLFLTINMGEATFFSPGAAGGPEWLFCIAGGYVLDVKIIENQRRRVRWM